MLKRKEIPWSEEQLDIIEAFKGTTDNLMVKATAGSGKTTLIVEGLAPHAPSGSVAVSFNKKIATELSVRLPHSVRSQTFNAFWFTFLRQRISGVQVEARKVQKIIKDVFPECDKIAWPMASLISLAKSECIGVMTAIDDVGEWMGLLDSHDFDFGENPDISGIIEKCIKVLALNNENFRVVDFDDQMYLSLKLIMDRGWNPDVAPVVFIDEMQDLNYLQEILVRYMGHRVVGVGDEYQAIYGFHGAGTDSMGRMEDAYDLVSYPMVTTRRVSKTGVEFARRFCPEIVAAEQNLMGEVRTADYSDMVRNIGNFDLVMCRINSSLVALAFHCLREGIPFEMNPKFPDSLIRWVRKFKCSNVAQLRTKISEWWEVEYKRLDELGFTGTIAREQDKVSTILHLCKKCVDVDAIVKTLQDICESTGGVFLSTIHGAKGLEGNHTVWLGPELCPSKHAYKDWQLKQENNLQFVASTRHKDTLTLVNLKKER